MIDVSSHYLSSIIYSALASGRSVVEATRDGRRAMEFADNHRFFDWGIPVLDSSSPNVSVFPHSLSYQTALSESTEESRPDVLPIGGVSSSSATSKGQGARTRGRRRAKRRVALVDINSKAGFLPDLVNAANRAQNYYHFQVNF